LMKKLMMTALKGIVIAFPMFNLECVVSL